MNVAKTFNFVLVITPTNKLSRDSVVVLEMIDPDKYLTKYIPLQK